MRPRRPVRRNPPTPILPRPGPTQGVLRVRRRMQGVRRNRIPRDAPAGLVAAVSAGRRSTAEGRTSILPTRTGNPVPFSESSRCLPAGPASFAGPKPGMCPARTTSTWGPALSTGSGLRTGDELAGIVGRRPPQRKKARPPALSGSRKRPPAGRATRRPDFNRLSALHPRHQLKMECGRMFAGEPDLTNRVIDLFCPSERASGP